MYLILNLIQPKYILSMNWITIRESLYKVWTARHLNSAFVVVQHGAYVGGVVTDLPHKYTKCDIFLTWGTFFKNDFIKNNSQKKVEIVSFGNPIYNEFNRDNFNYKTTQTNKILLLPTALDSENLVHFNLLLDKLKELNFQVYLKEHAKQGLEKNKNGSIKYPSIEGIEKIKERLYPLLKNNDFDFIISDHSSSLLDAIFFKNNVIYFDPNNEKKGYKTNYSNYLPNLYRKDFTELNKKSFYQIVDIEAQEALFNNMLVLGNNQLNLK
ncbi:hypothetical protein [Flavobacterium sp.]|uniref:hypothetical protein n=1 Tax=Flavobacterium sp. TaxID=239 RepID=UPI003F69B415